MKTFGIKNMNIDELCSKTEGQVFDRKSAKIEPTALANHITAFANADGGVLAIGIEDNGTITGIDDCAKNVNELFVPLLIFVSLPFM